MFETVKFVEKGDKKTLQKKKGKGTQTDMRKLLVRGAGLTTEYGSCARAATLSTVYGRSD